MVLNAVLQKEPEGVAPPPGTVHGSLKATAEAVLIAIGNAEKGTVCALKSLTMFKTIYNITV